MSLSPNPDGSGFLRQQSGKTPPPAPSAAYARRAREIQAEEGVGGRYRPPALRTVQGFSDNNSYEGSSARNERALLSSIEEPLAANNFPSSYRRARAGTLPSNVQLAAQNFASAMTPGVVDDSPITSPRSALPPSSLSSASIQSFGNISSRPTLRHAASAASTPSVNSPIAGASPFSQGATSGALGGAPPAEQRANRLRAGSLTLLTGAALPTGGLTDAFGPSIFSSSWLTQSTAQQQRDAFSTLDEIRSADSQAGEEYEPHTVHTLDYLGLDDNQQQQQYSQQQAQQRQQTSHQQGNYNPSQQQINRQAAVAAALSESRAQYQSGNSARIRARTVANPYDDIRTRRTAQGVADAGRTRLEETTDEEELEYANEYIGRATGPATLGIPTGSTYSRQRLDSYESSTPGGANSSGYGSSSTGTPDPSYLVARGFKATDHLTGNGNGGGGSRTRASSLGTVDEPVVRRRIAIEEPQSAGGYSSYRDYDYDYDATQVQQPAQQVVPRTLADHPVHHDIRRADVAQIQNLRNLQVDTAGALLQQQQAQLNLQQRQVHSPSVRFPSTNELVGQRSQLSGGMRDARDPSPKDGMLMSAGGQVQGGTQSQIQTPSRSLWIGNLDSSVSGEDLARAFAPYGAIESFRLLPEKECGFINFVDIADAMRAKDDVLNRLGGSIGQANGQTVRIGFGKADSAPATPSGPNSGGTHSSHFLNGSSLAAREASSPGGRATAGASGVNSGMSSDAGRDSMDAQLQSSPTRALWIGSIPSTTTPATILSVFSPFGPIESARVLTHKNCGFVNFERLDDAVRARKALNGRDVLGSDVGAIRIGFARVPVKTGSGNGDGEEGHASGIQGVGDLSVAATIHALRLVKGASAVPADQQVLGGAVENYRSNLLLSMLSSTNNPTTINGGSGAAITEQQMIMRMLSDGSHEADQDMILLSEFRPPMAYYSTIPVAAERTNPRRWDASKLRELRKRLDSGSCTIEEIDDVASDFLDGEIVDLASDWLGNTVVQKLFEKCSPGPRIAMLERIAPHLAMIGIHKNGTWAAQKVIECANTPDEINLIAINLRPYAPPLLLDQFGNYVVQCCLRFGSPSNEFIFDAMTDRLWEIAQGRFGARSMRACLESPYITLQQQRRIATAVILNSIPLATNPNGALLLTWLLDTSGFHSRYRLLAPRFTPHLSHLCTHKLASLTVLRIVNQKSEPEASQQVVQALFFSQNDHVLTDVLGDQINGVAVVHKILQSPYLDPTQRPGYLEATKRVLVDLKLTTAQAYRRLIEEVGLPIPSFANTPSSYGAPQQHANYSSPTVMGNGGGPKKHMSPSVMQPHFTSQGISVPVGYSSELADPTLANLMANVQLQNNFVAQHRMGQSPMGPQGYGGPLVPQTPIPSAAFSPSSDPFLPLPLRNELDVGPAPQGRTSYATRRGQVPQSNGSPDAYAQSPSLSMYPPNGGGILPQQGAAMMSTGMDPQLGSPYGMPTQLHPQMYQAYIYHQMYQQQQQQHPQNGYR